jgi:Outer membrane protein beta-barrel domain
MVTRVVPIVVVVLSLISAVAAEAQETGQAGLTMGYPGSIGFLWHPTDRVGIRPEISFGLSSGDLGTSLFSSDAWNLGLGVTGIFYLGRWDNLRTYVSPRFSFSRARSLSQSDNPFLPDSEVTTSTYSATGSFGAQYSISRKFSVYGEAGFGYTRGTLSGSPLDLESTHETWGTHSGVGVVFYF